MTQTDNPSTPLSEQERADYQRLEKQIALGQGNYIEVGLALEQIRDRRLYRERFKTFADYCATVWQMSRERARLLRRAAVVMSGLATTTNGCVLPENERQARALMDFDADLHAAIMRTAHSRAAQTGAKVTESLIRLVGNVYQEMADTGSVDLGDGTSTPIDAALTAEQHETMLRQMDHITEKSRRVKVTGQVYYCGDDYYRVAVDSVLIDPGALKVGDKVAVIFTPRPAEENDV